MLPLVLVAAIALTAQTPAVTAAPARAEAAFTLPDMRGLIEGIAFRSKTGAYYFGDVHLRCVWVLAAEPAMADATLGTLVGGDLLFIADGGWNRFHPGKVDARPRAVPVRKVPWAATRP